MKWFILFLSLIVMAGTLTPCCPADNCQNEAASHEKGMCSPFFACGGCTGFVQLSKPVSVPLVVAEPTIHYEKLSPGFTSDYYSTFFQPPRNNGC